MSFNLETYLARIGLSQGPATLEGLTALQRAQMATIAFEDIEPYLGIVPDLSPNAIWQKLVIRRRGGYCFELNGLFGAALKALGFTARPVLARVRMGAATGGIRAHLAWIATLEGRDYLVDAGFGGPGPFGPLELVMNEEQTVAGATFRFTHDAATGETLLQRREGEQFLQLFGFDDGPFTAIDIESANYLCTHWRAGAPFPDNLMLSLTRPEAQLTLMNRTAKRVSADGVTKDWQIASPAELERLVVEGFGLNYERRVIGALWEKLYAERLELAA
ncbi:arylamine N-acetyltransferase family protein [Afifella sp. YEN Y35]|uniref:arylamine N-acetyltransferase family protein n=1 Tax=Afifella sp. YEN Y35 TaxID=3388337 RepID=UPI0039DF3327